MNFMEAVKAMKEGKKVKRERWNYLFLRLKNDNQIVDNSTITIQYRFFFEDTEATDWQIYEEEEKFWNLADNANIQYGEEKALMENVKTFLQKLRGDLLDAMANKKQLSYYDISKIIDKRSGELK